jgi:ribosomal protein S27AE
MTKSQHVHKLKRLVYKSGNTIFFCALPDCSFKINPALALGKRSICWRCGESFIMSEYSLRLARPHCENCHKPKKEVDTSSLKDILETAEHRDGMSLAERLSQTIQQAQTTTSEEQEEDL